MKEFNAALAAVLEHDPRCNSTLLLDDCRKAMADMPPNSVHLILTDPPYFLDGLDDGWNVTKVKNSRSRAGVVGGLPTGMKFSKEQGLKLYQFMGEIAEHALRVLCPGGFFIAFAAPRLYHRMAVALDDTGFEVRDMYAWHYRKAAQQKAFSLDHFVRKLKISKSGKEKLLKSLGKRKTAQLRPQFEPMVLAQKPKQGTMLENWEKWHTGLADYTHKVNGRSPTTLLEYEKPLKESYNGHLTVKPVQLMEALIKMYTDAGQVVLDPFAGSGTTLLAARNVGREAIGIEVNEEYHKIALRRLGGQP